MHDRIETKYIAIHCSDTPPSMEIGVDEIRSWHVDDNKWSDIGYHYVIKRDGTIENGRDIQKVGAHERRINRTSVAICLVGGKTQNFKEPDFNYTDKQMASLRSLVTRLVRYYPKAQVVGHNEFSEKTCPNFNVPAWWAFGDIIEAY